MRVIGESDIMQEFLSESDEVCTSFVNVVHLAHYSEIAQHCLCEMVTAVAVWFVIDLSQLSFFVVT